MVTNKLGLSADLLIHPGETIFDILNDRNMNQKELAFRLGVSEPYISDVIHGKKDISRNLALGLEYVFGTPASFWLNLQANYDAELLHVTESKTISEEERTIAEKLNDVISFLEKYQMITDHNHGDDLILDLRRCFQVNSLLSLGFLVSSGTFMKSERKDADVYVTGAWLSMCRARMNNDNEYHFQNKNSDHMIAEIRKTMFLDEAMIPDSLEGILNPYGIHLHLMPSFSKNAVNGAIMKSNAGTYHIYLPGDSVNAYDFWFALFHELGHICLNHLARTNIYCESDDTDRKETAADTFAMNAMMNHDSWISFVNQKDFAFENICRFSKAQSVPVFIVTGRLQKEKPINEDDFTDQSVYHFIISKVM